jgi:uncharacterized membrane protein
MTWGSHLRGDRLKPHRSKAALLEFLPTAAGTRIVSPNALEGILKMLAAGTISFSTSLRPLLILAVLLAKAVPSG